MLTQGEYVAGLKWCAGLKFRDGPYICPDCGREADPHGVHAVTCQRSGFISRGHTLLRDTVGELLAKADIAAAKEQNLPNSAERPADILVSSWGGRTIALDFTIVTPSRASSTTSSTSNTTLMDQAAAQKQNKSQLACEAAGWVFQPFVADTYGALRTNARSFISHFIQKNHHKFYPLDEADAGRAIWSTVSAAIISRAAQQLCKLALTDSPFGIR